MKKQHHLRVQLGLFVAILSATFFLFLSGCDDANTPEQPPYRLLAQFQTPATAMSSAAKGDLVAVASGSYGVILLNTHDLSNLRTVYHNPVPRFAKVACVGLDTIHHYIAAGTDNSNSGDPFPIFNYLTGDTALHMSFSGPVEDFIFDSVEDTMTLWCSDNSLGDGLVATRFCKAPGDTAWGQGCNFPYADGGWSATGLKTFGFGRSSDGIFAIACEKSSSLIHGIHLIDEEKNHIPSQNYYISTPGMAYDCAWYGDKYIIVADQMFVTVIDVDSVRTTTDSLYYPKVVSSLFIPTADRLERVVIDGNYACVFDNFDGIYIVDISDVKNMKFVQLIDLPQPTSMTFDNGKLYATDQALGLVIYSRY